MNLCKLQRLNVSCYLNDFILFIYCGFKRDLDGLNGFW
ncbi:hypothetical protein SOHN41_02491 [Shewanella sp. HN-41]|nr:hypothetical protein SOHN41_02491 [Shewanella sp. HN-41]